MVQRSIYFLVVWLLMFNGKIFGQENSQNGEKKGLANSDIIGRTVFKIIQFENSIFKLKTENCTITLLEETTIEVPGCWGSLFLKGVVAKTYINHLGAMCRQELLLDKLTPINIRLRLGSLNYVNWLEQKPNAIKY